MGEVQPGASLTAPTVAAYRDTAFRGYHFDHNADCALHFRFQLPHRWNKGEVRLHIHYIPLVNPASTEYVIWQCQYSWAVVGSEIPAATGWTTAEARSTITTTSAFKSAVTGLLSTSPPEGANESAILMVRVVRLGAGTPITPGWTDTYTTSKTSPLGTAAANVFLLSCDLHFQSEKIGTITETPWG